MACWVVVMCILLVMILLFLPVGVLLISAKSKKPSRPIHIFLSFRGTDTRETFASLLYDALIREGFNVFMDDQSIPLGQEIEQVIHEAIERSLGAAIIFSRDFASSECCLNELDRIVLKKKMLGLRYVLVPIYVDGVQPYEVRNQRGSYAKAFAKHEKWGSNKHRVWEDALTKVSGYRGRILKGKWSKFINEIVEEIRQEFCKLGITVNPRCCAYHSTRMDRIHDAHESIKFLAIIGNLIFLFIKFLGSSLIKQLCTQFVQLMETINDKIVVVEERYGTSFVITIVIFFCVYMILSLAILNGKSWKKRSKRQFMRETMTPVTVVQEMVQEMAMLSSSNEALKERVTASTIKTTVKSSFVATMNKALSSINVARSL